MGAEFVLIIIDVWVRKLGGIAQHLIVLMLPMA